MKTGSSATPTATMTALQTSLAASQTSKTVGASAARINAGTYFARYASMASMPRVQSWTVASTDSNGPSRSANARARRRKSRRTGAAIRDVIGSPSPAVRARTTLATTKIVISCAKGAWASWKSDASMAASDVAWTIKAAVPTRLVRTAATTARLTSGEAARRRVNRADGLSTLPMIYASTGETTTSLPD